ncbi:helix-turn-helix domain-containing protein [Aequorivita capsosiphonis]|uniref:helix-turn-helix domain-containing protein n=1 Tax=Aequorivita capsosiphonis TaxID=487317 RepID=UPI0004298FEF|nr:AraC family transcriptional regulator [Aequorivita capsosiphonis]
MEQSKPDSISKPQQSFPLKEHYLLLKEEAERNQKLNEFPNGFCYQEYSINTKLQEHIKISQISKEGFYFIYCWKGVLSIKANATAEVILPFQSAIVYNKSSDDVLIGLDQHSVNQFCVISFGKPKEKALTAKNLFYDKFKNSYCSQVTKSNYIYIGRPYLKLLEKINSLSRMSKDDVACELIMQGLILQILGLKMEQVLNAFSNEHQDYGVLTQTEINRVQTVSDFIRENPSLNYSIEFLCSETRLSPAKLQEGFKKIHDRTVIDYIRNVRLEKAMELIKTTDLNISEIVYSIGLTSRSYFSKIFKNKYKCCPKSFQEQIRGIAGEK